MKSFNQLIATDPAFAELVERNRRLIAGSGIVFKIYAEQPPIGFHQEVVRFEGAMHTNGVTYLKAIDTTSMVPGKNYPVSLTGTVDWKGRFRLTVTKNKFQILGYRLPRVYSGEITEDGSVRLQLVTSEWSLFNNDKAEKMIVDPFRGDEQRREAYLATVAEIAGRLDRVE